MLYRLLLATLLLTLPCRAEDLDLSGFYGDSPASQAADGLIEAVSGGGVDLSGFAAETAKPARRHRVIIMVGDTWCPPCVVLEPALVAALEKLKAKGWSVGETADNHVQVVRLAKDFDADDFPSELAETTGISFPYLVKIEDGKVVRRWRYDADARFDAYTINWLFTGKHRTAIEAQPPPAAAPPALATTEAHYPLRGGFWGLNGDYSPPRESLEQHLAASHNFDRAWLAQLSYSELQSLHADDHEGRTNRTYANKPVPAPQRQTRQTWSPPQQFIMRLPSRGGGCPTCPYN
jgi:thiol-disulfide isomerase/thioredoxin